MRASVLIQQQCSTSLIGCNISCSAAEAEFSLVQHLIQGSTSFPVSTEDVRELSTHQSHFLGKKV